MLFRFAYAVLAVCSLAAQTPNPGSVSGSVVSTTGEPLRKAEVTMRAVGGRGAVPSRAGAGPMGRMGMAAGGSAVFIQTTDPSGRFAFSDVPAGSYQIYVQRNGFVRSQMARPGMGVSGEPVTVSSGQAVTGITIRMSPHSVVAGRVVDEDGDPMVHVTVQVLRERWLRGRRQLTPASADATNDLGEYRIANILPGSYYLLATSGRPEPPGARPRPEGATADMRYGHQFHPQANDLTQAVPLRLEPGQELRGMDFQLRKTSAFRVRGRVLDENGKPAMAVGINAIPADGYFLGSRGAGVARNAEGMFELGGLLPGTYTLVASRQGRDQARSSALQVVTIGNRDVDGILIQLQSGVNVTGRVVLPEGVTPTAPARVVFERTEAGFPFGGAAITAAVDTNGAWNAQNVVPGRYRISVSPLPPGTYLKAVMAGGQDVTAGAEVSGPAEGVEVQLGPKAPEVSGLVTGPDKLPAAEATVVFIPDASVRDRYWLFRTVSADENGAFRMTGLTPGRYTVLGLREVEDGEWYSPEFLRRMEGRGTAIKVEEGSAETVQVSLADAA